MKQSNSLITETIETTQQAESSACFARFGLVVAINTNLESVRVDFEGNLYGRPISAKIGRQFRKSELEMAIENKLTCRIEFLNGDINLPVLTDVFFSLLNDDKPLVLRAPQMVIEAEQELIVKSGETQTRYSGRDGRITTRAKYVTSQAEKAQKIQGSTIAIN
ncbi:hypothetical protein [uncultured Photobacterium sp.]|uniref:hypothetical protein n=1 Tax=uncultured Photobacterium sp. TaxID=173973 RepID=UPI0026237392|nr:hypothetical protein [uncultured Photobacterium sp.]